MKLNRNKLALASFLPLFLASGLFSAARKDKNQPDCTPTPPAPCNPDECCRIYCLGPDIESINAPVRPYTCNGDWVITAAGFYWNAHQDGMEYAIVSEFIPAGARAGETLIDSVYKNPDFKWDFGFKLGIGYNTTCDGWDIGILWTHYRGKAFSHNEAELEDNFALLPLWSDFGLIISAGSANGTTGTDLPLFATDIETNWKLDLNLIDIELGREFWTGKRVSLRPFVGLRVAFIKQDFGIVHHGGNFEIPANQSTFNLPVPVNDFVKLNNDFKAVGIRPGLNSIWNIGCGWGIYGESALSILYGRFDIEHREKTKEIAAPFDEDKVMETKDGFRAARLALDLALGVKWSALFCDCKYGFSAQLGWENHLFLDQNQLWRVTKSGAFNFSGSGTFEPKYTNTFVQNRGTLDTQGWTLTLRFEF